MDPQLTPLFSSMHVFVPSDKTLDVIRTGVIEGMRGEKQWNVDLDGTKGMLISLSTSTSGLPIAIDMNPTEIFQEATGFGLTKMSDKQVAALKNVDTHKARTTGPLYVLGAGAAPQ